MIMDYFILEPEVAGGLGDNTIMDTSVHPPRVEQLHYEIDYGWLGDELLESYPCYIVTQNLASSLATSGLGRFELDEAEVSLTPEAQEEHEGKEIPRFQWLRVTGIAGQDDLGVTSKGQLVVSERALQVLQTAAVDNCDIEPYTADR
ncbi:hypothetical protein [Microlunatus sp. GCM10028923]|uniref:hypothetical protein n=1 Tax=Microlunatus sp. GCM10028923 TaxID=3273400 RepID=UPI00361E7295